MIKRFFESALWLLEKYPVNCPREFFAGWLLRSICKNGETRTDAKKKLVKDILTFLELPKRGEFEKRLCIFISSYDMKIKKRGRFVVQDKITGQVEWARTICENMISSPGAFTSFIARPHKQTLDADVLLVLKNIASELWLNLEYFAEILGNNDFAERIELLKQHSADIGSVCRIYDEHIAWKLRRTPDGRELAAEIEKWHFHSSINLQEHIDEGQLQALKQLLPIITQHFAEESFNENDLLEGISIIQSAYALTEMNFSIKCCRLNTKKPSLELVREVEDKSIQKIIITKNIPGFSTMDRTKEYRTVDSTPSGLQPDIIYQCTSKNGTFYLLGDAKNYEKSDLGPALYAMLHYLLAFSKELDLPPDFFNPESKSFLKISDSYKRIVLFFPESKAADIAADHPIQLVFGEDIKNLQEFFSAAFGCGKKSNRQIPEYGSSTQKK